MSDIQQSDSPIINEPTLLGEEALKPADQSDLLQRMMREAEARKALEPEQPKRRGRPPGPGRSRLVTPGSSVPSGSGSTEKLKTPAEIERDRVARREAKQRRAAELNETILQGVNEQIILALTSMGVPAKLLYKEGQIPRAVASNSKYSDFAGRVLISPHQADNFAKFIVELEGTELGKKATGMSGDGKGPLYFYGIMSVFAAIQYLQGLSTFYKELKPLLDAYQAAQMHNAARAQQEQEDKQAASGSPIQF